MFLCSGEIPMWRVQVQGGVWLCFLSVITPTKQEQKSAGVVQGHCGNKGSCSLWIQK